MISDLLCQLSFFSPMERSRLSRIPEIAAPAMQGMPPENPGKGMFPQKYYCPPSPPLMIVAMTAIFFEENISHCLSIMMAIP